jgi:hypothetical protein
MWRAMYRYHRAPEDFPNMFTRLMTDRRAFRVLNDVHDADTIARFRVWDEQHERDPDQLLKCFENDRSKAMQVIAFPPHFHARDIANTWTHSTGLGTKLHRDIELYLNNLPVRNTTREWDFFLEYIAHEKAEVFRTELNIGVREFRLAGQIDCLVRYPDGTYGILDWKRSLKLKPDEKDETAYGKLLGPWSFLADNSRNKYFIQLNIYQRVCEMMNVGLKISRRVLLVFHPQNDSAFSIEVPDFHELPEYDAAMKHMFTERLEKVRAYEQAERESMRDDYAAIDTLPETTM